jgi:hypothetical protein
VRGTFIQIKNVELRKKHPIGTPAFPTAARVESTIQKRYPIGETVFP